MMRRVLLGCGLVLGLLGGLPLAAQQTTPSWTCPADFSGQTLHVANWSTYIADNTISNFSALCKDITVEYTEFNDDTEILTQLRQGDTRYDVVIPDNSVVGVMIAEGLLEELNHDNLPNLKNLDPIFAQAAYDPNNIYSVPYQWGTIGIGYRKSMFETAPTSWNDVFNYDKPMVWIDFPRQLLGIALFLNGDDPTSGDPDAIAKARNFLIDHSAHATLKPDSEAQDALFNGDVHLVIENSGDILQLNTACDCNDFGYVIPSEGSNIWVDSMVIPADAEHKRLAEAFIDYILDPAVSADISNATQYATPNKTAIDEKLVDDLLLSNPAIYPFETLRKNKMFFLRVLTPDEMTLYNDAWSELKMLAGHGS